MNKVWGLIFGALIVAECVCVVLDKTIAFGVVFGAIIVAIGALLLWLGKPKKLAIMFIVAGVLLATLTILNTYNLNAALVVISVLVGITFIYMGMQVIRFSDTHMDNRFKRTWYTRGTGWFLILSGIALPFLTVLMFKVG